MRLTEGAPAEAAALAKAALTALETRLGTQHPWTQEAFHVAASASIALARANRVAEVRTRRMSAAGSGMLWLCQWLRRRLLAIVSKRT